MFDFREVKDTAKRVAAELRAEDANWSWRAEVTKGEVKVFWSYLQYIDTKTSHFSIVSSDLEGSDDFIKALNERGEYISGAIVGSECWADGDLSKCVELMMRAIASRAHRCY